MITRIIWSPVENTGRVKEREHVFKGTNNFSSPPIINVKLIIEENYIKVERGKKNLPITLKIFPVNVFDILDVFFQIFFLDIFFHNCCHTLFAI